MNCIYSDLQRRNYKLDYCLIAVCNCLEEIPLITKDCRVQKALLSVDTRCLVYVNLVKTEEGMKDLIKHLKLITSSEIGKVRLVVTTFLDTTAYISLHFFVSVSESVSH